MLRQMSRMWKTDYNAFYPIARGVFLILLGIFVTISGASFFTGAAAAGDILNVENPDAHPKTTRILFIGNSLTYYYELPTVLSKLAQSLDPSHVVETEMVTEGGASLQSLWFDGKARAAIRAQQWDYIVLQEHGTLGGGNRLNGHPVMNNPALFQAFAALFDKEIDAIGAQTVLMLTWALKSKPDRQPKLNHAYISAAKDLGAVLVPAGLAWQRALTEDP